MIKHSKGKVKIEESSQDVELREKMKHLMTEFLKFRQNFAASNKSLDELLSYSLKLTSIGLDCPTVFNFRKDLLMKFFDGLRASAKDKNEADASETFARVKETVDNEIKFLTKIAMEDPKSYEIWFHRAWIIKAFAEQEAFFHGNYKLTKALIEGDLAICEKYLKKDERNFHVWNYRLELNKALLELFPEDQAAVVQKELDFISAKLEENFSNYSAIHFFTKYVQMKSDLAKNSAQSFIDPKLLLAQLNNNIEALSISPNEQALWLFQRWLIESIVDIMVLHAYLEEDSNTLFVTFNKALPASLAGHIFSFALNGKEVSRSDYSVTKSGRTQFAIAFHDKASSDAIVDFYLTTAEGAAHVLQVKGASIECRQPLLSNKIKDSLQCILEQLEEVEVPSLETRIFKTLNIFLIRHMLIVSQWYEKKDEVVARLKAHRDDFLQRAQNQKHQMPILKRIISKASKEHPQSLEDLVEFKLLG